MRHRLVVRALFGAVVCSLFLVACSVQPPVSPPVVPPTSARHQACPLGVSVVLVDTSAHRLSLCHAGHEEAAFRVALGRGGIDKRVRGDERTPLGRYYLGLGRHSDSFHLFLPVGYPTTEQARLGYTGSDIGIHGPDQDSAEDADQDSDQSSDQEAAQESSQDSVDEEQDTASSDDDWTLGCIAVSTRKDIEAIAAWVAEKHIFEIIIL
ncbi:MAG: L,D-transpeptidase [Magnetococcales bacterium]|nr:L,D-transpeptidase [Magnetococcales bacterium]